MSDLTDMMADDLAILNGASGDLSVACVLHKAEGGTGAIYLTPGDNTDALVVMGSGMADNRTFPATGIISAMVTSAGRAAQPGDKIVFATGVLIGTWTVSAAVPDEGDGINLMLRSERIFRGSRSQQ